jgi:hypothetical protein
MLLNTIQNINSALAVVRNNSNVRPELFYSKILLDTIKVPQEDYVHLKHASTTRVLPAGHQKLELKRLGTWTAHTQVLREGMPPRPDLTRSESIEVGYTQFGRFAFFTDQIRTDVLVDFVAHYSKELSDLANRTLEKFAREKLLSAPSAFYANGKTSVGQLAPGDVVTIADLRLITLKFSRMFVDPIDGFYNYICSPEFMYDMIDDPYVKYYMETNNNTFELYSSGKPFPLFKIKYIETRLDENLAPDLDHPGEYMDGNGTYWLRMVTKDGSLVYSVKNEAASSATKKNESDVTDTALASRHILTEYYYRDGSAIENRVYWKIIPTVVPVHTNVSNILKWNTSTKKYEAVASAAVGDDPGILTAFGGAGQRQATITNSIELPINRGIFTGAKGLVRVQVEGQGATQIIVKGLGSAGTNDPLDQLSSIGFKIQGVGFGFERPEAVFVTYSVPNHALDTAGISRDAILGKQNHVNEKGMILNVSNVDKYQSTTWVTGTVYKAGQHFNDGTNEYVAVVDHTASAALATDVTAGKVVKLGTVVVNNPSDLGLAK